MAPFLGGIFRSGRTTPTSARTYTPDPPTPKSSTQRAPPSSFKRSQPSPAPTNTPSTPGTDASSDSRASPAPPIKVKDFASIGGTPIDPPAPPPLRPLPPTPDISPLRPKGHSRSTSGASALSSKSSVKRNVRPSPSHPHLHLPPTAYTPPKAHQRAASGPTGASPSPLSAADGRQRSSTMQSTLTRAPEPTTPSASTKTVDQPITPSRPVPAPHPLGSLGRILRTPDSKRRPAKLTLRTSNLTPPRSPTQAPAHPPLPLSVTANTAEDVSRSAVKARLDVVKESEGKGSDDSNHTISQRNPSIRRVESDQTLRPTRPERPRSASYGDIPLLQAPPLPDGPDAASVVAIPALPAPSTTITDTPSTPSRTRRSPEKTTTTTPLTTAPSSPAQTHRRTPSQPFEVIPLPWTTSSAPALSQELGARFDDLIAFTLNRLPTTPPRVLRPSVLKTSANEDGRLRLELNRLRAKYDSITRHRDGLLASLGHPDITSDLVNLRKTTDSLRRSVARCDRIARQIFICNDQIRQIEVQGEQHVVGTLRVSLSRAQEAVRARASSLSMSSETESDSAMSMEPSEDDHEHAHVDIRRVTFVPSPIARAPTAGGDEEERHRRFDKASQDDANRMSVATIISLNQLGFPLPPDRHFESPPMADSIETIKEKDALARAIHLEIVQPTSAQRNVSANRPDDTADPVEELRPPLTARSASTSQLEVTIDSRDEILIYPPSHRRSSSLPLLSIPGGMDLPHTPWKDQYDYPGSNATSTHVNANHVTLNTTSTSTVQVASPASVLSASGTPPLRVKTISTTRTRATGGKALSLKPQRRLSDTTKRARRGRESQLETPESILLSLATAGLWTKQGYDEIEMLSP